MTNVTVRRRRAPTALALIVVAALSAFAYTVRPVGSELALLGLAIIWISLVPAIVHLTMPDPPPVPFFPAVGAFYAIFFGLPVFVISFAWPDADSIFLYSRVAVGEIRAFVLVLAAAGIASMVVAFYFARSIVFNRFPIFRLPHVVSQVNAKLLLWPLLITHLIEFFVPGWTGFASAKQFLEPAGFVALGAFYFLWRLGAVNRWETLLLVGIALPLELYVRTRTLFLTDFIFFLLFAIFALWRCRQWKTIAGCVGLVVLSLTLYGTSAATRHAYPPGIDRILFSLKMYTQHFLGGQNTIPLGAGEKIEFWGRFGSLVMRTGHIWVFHVVATRSPDPVPYWGGESYRTLATALVPRIIFPDKPEERFGARFGQRYGLLEPQQHETSINLPWITELLANFGPVGVITGMAAIGMLLAFLDRIFNARESGPLEAATGLSILVPLSYPESNFSVMIGSSPLYFVALCTYFFVGAWMLRGFSGKSAKMT